MQKNMKYQLEIDTFRNIFKQFQEKRIIIYGIGRRTATLLPALKDFRIVGLLDRDKENIGKVYMGIPILSLDEIQDKADLIVINSDPTNFEVIYKRIKDVKLPVYYADGRMAQIRADDIVDMQDAYWDKSFQQLENEIEKHEIVSFDLFDTLIMRKILEPGDLFRLVEQKVNERLSVTIPFMSLRQQAAALCQTDYPDIDFIYRKLIQISGLPEEIANQIKDIEIQTEIALCVPRKEMAELFKRTYEAGKEVYIISDMYLPVEIIGRILKKCQLDFFPSEQIWISCEKKKSKEDGSLWKMYQERVCKRKKALHIGDECKADVEAPCGYGIDTYYVMSAREMARRSSIADILPQVTTVTESVFVGLIAAKLFNNPFILCESRGKIVINECHVFGYCVYGGVVNKFLSWLYLQLKQNMEERVIFFARDGYFLIEDFHVILKHLKECSLETVYLPISRRLIYMSTLLDPEDFNRILDMPFIGTFEEYMDSRFCIQVNETTKDCNKQMVDELKKEKDLAQWIEPYGDEIKERAATERKNYILFLKNKKLWDSPQKDAVVDLCFYGTNQFYYQKLIGKKMRGYYFWCCHAMENPYKESCDMSACFNDLSDPEAKQSPSKHKLSFLESFLTAPYGMIRYIDDQGDMVCEADRKNQHNFAKKIEMNEGIKEFMQDYFEMIGIDQEPGEDKLKEILYEELLSGKCEVGETVLEGLYFDNDMIGSGEYRLEV